MPFVTDYRRRGMTLIELLVVITILGLLAVTVIPNLSNTSDRRKVREAARNLSSFVAGGQSRALGSRSGGGLWIDPLPNPIATGSLSIVAAIDLAEADVPQPYSGNLATSTITALTPVGTGTMTATFSDPCGPLVSGTNLIRLGGGKTTFALVSTANAQFTSAMIVMAGSGSLNQTIHNTTWPKIPSAGGITYEIVTPPTRSAGSTLTLSDGVALDVYHSWFRNASLQTLVGANSFQILFDSTGRPQHLAFNGSRVAINDVLYLLIASIESIQNSGLLAPTDGYWVAIDPMGGVPRVAEVYTSGTSIVDQQRYIRQGVIQQGR